MWYNTDMKAKTSLKIQTIGMYIMHLPLYAVLVLINLNMDVYLQETLTKYCLLAALALMALMVPVSIFNVIVSIKSAFQGEDPTKSTKVAKLSLIPWYVLNFFIGYVFVSIFFNPFMFITIPLAVAALMGSTYMLMLCTSIADIAYVVHNRKSGKIDSGTKFAVVLLFIFCLDVVGAIILHKKSKKISDQAQAEVPVPAEEE